MECLSNWHSYLFAHIITGASSPSQGSIILVLRSVISKSSKSPLALQSSSRSSSGYTCWQPMSSSCFSEIVLSGRLRVTYWLLTEEERHKYSWYWFDKKIMMINNDYLVWFSARWMRRNMCASCRILHNPRVFRNLLWWWNMPSLLIGSESTRVYVHEATDGWIF